MNDDKIINEDYKYGFKTDVNPYLTSGKGLNEDVIRFISHAKGEPEFMLNYRLESYKQFVKLQNPKWGPDLSGIDFQDYTYYVKSTKDQASNWEKVPTKIKDTFAKLGIPEAEAKYLAGTSTQFESEVVYHKNLKELDDLGVIFCDTDTALRKYPELFQKYFGMKEE